MSPNLPGFKSGFSCIKQILSITYETYKSFDNYLEVWGIPLDILKAFNKV